VVVAAVVEHMAEWWWWWFWWWRWPGSEQWNCGDSSGGDETIVMSRKRREIKW